MLNYKRTMCKKSVLCLSLCILTLPGILSSGLQCEPGVNTTVWSQSSRDIEVTVEWGYAQLTCNSQNICYGSEYVPDIKIDPQLKPVEIQHGVVLKFKPTTKMGINFPLFPYKVNEQGFLNCNKTGGFPIVQNETNETITVSPDHLDIGVNYFIVDLDDHKLVSCEFGLRLNITVKDQNCWNNGDKCGGRGNCISIRGQPKYTCACCDMFKGEYCDTFDSCLSRPCLNGARCQHNQNSDGGDFTCHCRLGYHGTFCSERVDNLCSLDLCHNNGTCFGNRTHFECRCLPGYTGSHCEVNINECEVNPCQHGVCVDMINGFECFCVPGYHGKRCNNMYDLCQTSPCVNAGICIKELDDYRCQCHPGYTGRHCSDKVDLCKPNPCFNGSKCSYDNGTCHCSPGYKGTRCEINLNECEPNPCLNGGTCKDFVDGYRCLCHELHDGPNCEYTIDMFAPFLQGKSTELLGPNHIYHVENLYIVAGTLSGAILIVIIVLTTCYCRMHETYKHCSFKRLQYNRQRNDARETSVDVSSVSNPRLSIDAIWEATSLNYNINQLNSPLRQSLKTKNI